MGFRGPRPGTRLPAHPGPSRALGPARAHPAPSQHSLLTDCSDSDSALPQATIQLSPIGTSCQTQAPAQLLALTAASDSDDSPEAISLSCTFGPADKPGAGPSWPTGALSPDLHATTALHQPVGLPLKMPIVEMSWRRTLHRTPPELDRASLRGGPDKHVDRGPHQAPRPGARPGARQAHRPGALQPSRRIKPHRTAAETPPCRLRA
jgi:hypothetical protein